MLQINLPQSGSVAGASVYAHLAGKRLLLAGMQVAALGAMLAQWRIQIVVAESAQRVLECLIGTGEAFDILLVDDSLPDMPGHQLLAMLAGPAYELVRPPMLMLLADEAGGDALLLPEMVQLLPRPLAEQVLLRRLSQPAVVPLANPEGLASVPRLSILLVDACHRHEMLAARLMKYFGHQLLAVQNGDEATQVLEGMRFDLLLMDSQLPVQDGLQLTRQIRRLEMAEQRKRVPIILMTAQVQAGSRAQALAAGADGLVARPLEPRQFRAALAQVFALNAAVDMQEVQTLRAASPVLVLKLALDRFGGNKALLQEIIGIFLSDFPVQLATVEQGLASKDHLQIRLAAHGIKGAASTLSAIALPRLAGIMEDAATAGDLAAVGMVLPVLRAALLEFVAALRLAVVDIDAALSACE